MQRLAYGLAIVLVAGIFAFMAESNSTLTIHGYTWGPVQTGHVVGVGSMLGIRDSTGAVLLLRYQGSCDYAPGDLVSYQISTVDPAIGTQHIRLVDAPSCVLS